MYVGNLVLDAKLRSMKQSLHKAWGLVNKYKEATRASSPKRMPKMRYKLMTDAKPTFS